MKKIIEAIGIWRTIETIQAAAFLKYWGERQNIGWKTRWVNNIKTGYDKKRNNRSQCINQIENDWNIQQEGKGRIIRVFWNHIQSSRPKIIIEKSEGEDKPASRISLNLTSRDMKNTQGRLLPAVKSCTKTNRKPGNLQNEK